MEITSGYEAMMLMLPPEHLPHAGDDPQQLMQRLLHLASRLRPKQLATTKRAPKITQPKGYVDGSVARSHITTARVLQQAARERR